MDYVSGLTLWLTGMSGAGKSSIGFRIAREWRRRGLRVELLDGDTVRKNLSNELGFTKEDRDTNVQRIGFVANMLSRNGVYVIVAAISPYRAARESVRAIHGNERFVEVYVQCELETLIKRDVKGLYGRALKGEIANFTGVSDPYEPPLNPNVVVNTARETIEESTRRILCHLSGPVGANRNPHPHTSVNQSAH